jgi:hypothetical protein
MHHLMPMGSSAAPLAGDWLVTVIATLSGSVRPGLQVGAVDRRRAAWPSVGYRREALGMAYALERDVDYEETSRRLSCSAKSLKSLILKVASGKSWARQHAAIQLSLAGRGSVSLPLIARDATSVSRTT